MKRSFFDVLIDVLLCRQRIPELTNENLILFSEAYERKLTNDNISYDLLVKILRLHTLAVMCDSIGNRLTQVEQENISRQENVPLLSAVLVDCNMSKEEYLDRVKMIQLLIAGVLRDEIGRNIDLVKYDYYVARSMSNHEEYALVAVPKKSAA